jgi:hypothetical protein
VVLGLCTVNMLWVQILSAQRLSPSFSQVAERTLGFRPAGLAVRIPHERGRAEIAVLSQSPPGLHLFALEESGHIALLGSTPLTGEREGLLAGERAYLSLASDGTAVSVLKEKEGMVTETLLPIPVKSQRIALADIGGSGRKDIVLYGKSRTGVSTLLARPGGGYVAGPELFGDISVSDLRCIDLNGDGIPDVLLCDWLSNRLILFYGISRMVFSEQVAADLPGEPEALACTWIDRHRALGVAVAVPSERKILFVRASPAGDIEMEGAMPVPGRPLGVEFVSLNGDPFTDLVAPAAEGTIVSTGAGEFQFDPPVLFGPGASPAGWALADLDGDGRPDFAVAERASKRLVLLANAQHAPGLVWPSTYAAGSGPRGLLARDLNGDGIPDIAAANTNSASVSIFMGEGQGRFDGGVMAFVSDAPAHLTSTHPPAGLPATLVSSHTSADRIGVLTLESSPLRASAIAIPTGVQPFVLHAWADSASVMMLTRYEQRESRTASLSLFEQISGGQFLERSIRFSLTDHVAAATMERSSAGGTYTVAYIASGSSGRASTLQSAVLTPSFAVHTVRPGLPFSDSSSATVGIVPATLGQGRGGDYIIVMGKPVHALLLIRRNPDGSFRSDREWIRNVSVRNDDDIVVEDVDGDGWPDITVREGLSESVTTFYGGHSGFSGGRRICSSRGVGGIAVAPLASPSARDLVLSRTEEGTISILFNPFRR